MMSITSQLKKTGGRPGRRNCGLDLFPYSSWKSIVEEKHGYQLSAAFFHLGVIRVTVPVQSSSGESDVAKDEDKVTLNMEIKKEAFVLSASSDTIEPKILEKLKAIKIFILLVPPLVSGSM